MFIAGGVYLLIVLYNLFKEIGEIREEISDEKERYQEDLSRAHLLGTPLEDIECKNSFQMVYDHFVHDVFNVLDI